MSEAAASRRRILVVEDELLIALDIGACLDALGFDVVGPVGRVAEAIAIVNRESLDAAILDVKLRDEEQSYPIADRLLARAVPVIFCTAYDEEGIDPPYAGCPALRKPFSQADLGAALGRLLA
jgi:CheY-like chemotaxis protein